MFILSLQKFKYYNNKISKIKKNYEGKMKES